MSPGHLMRKKYNARSPLNHDRREMAKKAAVGVTLAGAAWQKPVVEHVILPAHAQTSPSDGEVTCVEPLICAVAGSFSPTGGATTVCGTITSLSATICPPEAGRTIEVEILRVSGTFESVQGPYSFTTNNDGVVSDEDIDISCFPTTNEVLVRFTLAGAPEVDPCEVAVTEI
jgi:hypothetical protein